MKIKIIHISDLVIIAIAILGVFFIESHKISEKYETVPIGNKTSNITINNDGTIDVIDNIQINISQSRKQ